MIALIFDSNTVGAAVRPYINGLLQSHFQSPFGSKVETCCHLPLKPMKYIELDPFMVAVQLVHLPSFVFN